MLNIEAFTDGSCLVNCGCGGYAAIMTAKGQIRKASGNCKAGATNNRMELKAVICVVDWINKYQKEPCHIKVFTDSSYVVTTSKKTVRELTNEGRKNCDLWQELITKKNAGKHKIEFVKIDGHNGIELNERADKLAKEQARKARHERFKV